MSISGMISFGLPDGFSFVCPSISISGLGSCGPKEAPSLPRAARRAFATGCVELYVSVMTWVMSSGDRCFRMDEIERRTRSVKRASNWATARSSKTKLFLISNRAH